MISRKSGLCARLSYQEDRSGGENPRCKGGRLTSPNPKPALPTPLSVRDFFFVYQNFDLLGDQIPEDFGGKIESPHTPTEEKVRIIMMLAALGKTKNQIASAIGATQPTLRKHYFSTGSKYRIRNGEARNRLEAKLLAKLYQGAEVGNIAAIKALWDRLDNADLKLARAALTVNSSGSFKASTMIINYNNTAPSGIMDVSPCRFLMRFPSFGRARRSSFLALRMHALNSRSIRDRHYRGVQAVARERDRSSVAFCFQPIQLWLIFHTYTDAFAQPQWFCPCRARPLHKEQQITRLAAWFKKEAARLKRNAAAREFQLRHQADDWRRCETTRLGLDREGAWRT